MDTQQTLAHCAELHAKARYYALTMGIPVIPLHHPIFLDAPSGARWAICSCGDHTCNDIGKHPRVRKNGDSWGSTDPAQIDRWWGAGGLYPMANIGLATGRGLIVVDVDDRKGPQAAAFRELMAHAGISMSVIVVTGRGHHAWFRGNLGGSSHCGDGPREHRLLVRGDRSFVLAPPSLHATRHQYSFVPGCDVPATWNTKLQEWYDRSSGGLFAPDAATATLGPLPAHLQGYVSRGLMERATGVPWSPQEQLRVCSMLGAIDPDIHEAEWIEVLMILKDLAWVGEGGTDLGEEIAHEWSAGGHKYRGADNFARHWASCGRRAGRRVGLGTLVSMAQAAGWKGELRPLSARNAHASVPMTVNGPLTDRMSGGTARVDTQGGTTPRAAIAPGYTRDAASGTRAAVVDADPIAVLQVALGARPVPPAEGRESALGVPFAPLGTALAGGLEPAIVWADGDKSGRPKGTCNNAILALNALNVSCRIDTFHDVVQVKAPGIVTYRHQFEDLRHVPVLRNLITDAYGFDPGDRNTYDACMRIASRNAYDPVVEALARYESAWDGVSRADTWLTTYLGAEDTPLNRAIGRIILVALARRARSPGCKFDTMIVFVSPQGSGKSSAIEILVGPENFSDARLLGESTQRQMEALKGVWGHECSELDGIRRAERDALKGMLSRRVDIGRRAYARNVTHQPRVPLIFGTTNEWTFLADPTGGRRFLVVHTGRIDLAGLARVRELLLGEGAKLESAGEPIVLPEALWGASATQAEAHYEDDAWEQRVATYVAEVQAKGTTLVTTELVATQCLGFELKDVTRGVQMRIGDVFMHLRYARVRGSVGGKRVWHYVPRP